MIRKLYLMNQKGLPYFFDYRTHTLMSNVSGLGFSHEITYLKFNDFYERVERNTPLSEISGTLTFLKGYSGYSTFLNYLKDGDKGLRLYYQSDNLKYAYVEIKSVSKAELQGGVLQCDIVFDKTSPWLKDNIISLDLNMDERGKVYPYAYPYFYSLSYEGKVNIHNQGSSKAPLKIEMIGAVNNPEILVKRNGEVISTLRLYKSSSNCRITISSDIRDQYIVMEEAGVSKDIYQDQDFTCDNFLFIEPGESLLEFKPGVNEPTSCRITMTEGYLGN